MKREFSAGGLVFKRVGNEILWLVRRPTPNPEYRGKLGWSFPKGWIDDALGGGPGEKARGEMRAEKEDMEQAALREVKEEGGVEAKIVMKLETLKVFFVDQKKEKVMKFITYFVMEYERDVPEGHGWETEEVRWVTAEEGEVILAFKNEKDLLKMAGAILGKGR
jgi:8-oxo-dGTP pyrophosphatase MutT (NUDIX family)